MTLSIIRRKAWGATPWRGSVYSVAPRERTHFLVHYHGGKPRNDRGDANAREIESIHLRNGWAGIGYNFVVGQDGEVREGRGWSLVGAHCPGKNRTGIGVYVAVGGDQEPTEAAKRAVVALYDEACRLAGRELVKSYHGAHIATSCAGPKLTAWAKAGFPLDGTTAAPERDLPRGALLSEDGVLDEGTRKALQRMWGVKGDGEWGPATRKAIQKWAGVKQDGEIGPKTRKAVQKKIGHPQTGVWNYGWETKRDTTTAFLEAYYNRAVRARGKAF